MCYEATTRLVFIEKTKLNLLTSHLLVKVGFLDNNLLRTFRESNEVGFGWSWTCFKALKVSYNFSKNRLLQKTYKMFIIFKIPLEGQNCQKWISSKMIQKWPSCIFLFQTPLKLSRNHKNFRVWSFILNIHQRFKKRYLPFLVWNDHFALSVVLLFLHNFCPLSIFNI